MEFMQEKTLARTGKFRDMCAVPVVSSLTSRSMAFISSQTCFFGPDLTAATHVGPLVMPSFLFLPSFILSFRFLTLPLKLVCVATAPSNVCLIVSTSAKKNDYIILFGVHLEDFNLQFTPTMYEFTWEGRRKLEKQDILQMITMGLAFVSLHSHFCFRSPWTKTI